MAATRTNRGRRRVECENGFCERVRHYVGSQAHMDCLADLERRKYNHNRTPQVQPTQMQPALKEKAPEEQYKDYSVNAAPGSASANLLRPKDYNKEGVTIGITARFKPINGVNHYQIVALHPVEIERLGRTIPSGTRGGWVADPSKVSPQAWVDESSHVGEDIYVQSGSLISNSTLTNETGKSFKVANAHIRDVSTPGGKLSGVVQNADVLSSVIAGPTVVASVNNGAVNDIKIYNSYLDRSEISGENVLVDSSYLPGALIGGVKNPKDTIVVRGVRTAPVKEGKPSLIVAASRVSLTSNMKTRKVGNISVTADVSQGPELTLEGVMVKGSQVQIKGNHTVGSTVITGSVEQPARIVNSQKSIEVREAVVNPGATIQESVEFSVSGQKPHEVDVRQEPIYSQRGPTPPERVATVPQVTKQVSKGRPMRPIMRQRPHRPQRPVK